MAISPTPLPMLQYVLVFALEQVGVGGSNLPSKFILEHYGTEDKEREMWKTGVAEGALCVLGNALPDSDQYAMLIRRASRMIMQSGMIQWDRPENNVQVEQEAAWTNAKNMFLSKEQKKDQRADVRWKKRRLVRLTEEEKAALLKQEPLLPDARVGHGKDMAIYHLPLDKDTFVFNSIGVIYGSYDNSELAGRMVRMGLIDLVSFPTNANNDPFLDCGTFGEYQLGPRYLAYMKRWKRAGNRLRTPRGEWKKVIKRLNAKWNTDYKASDWPSDEG